MLTFTLPNFYHNFKINQFFILLNDQDDKYFKEKIRFEKVSGNFPYCISAGNKSVNQINNFATYYDIINCQREYAKTNTAIQLDCSNYFLNEDRLNNGYLNLIFNLLDNCGVSIEISNLNLIPLLDEKIKFKSYIFSANNCLREEDLELINQLTEKLDLVYLNPDLNENLKFLKQIKTKNKIGLIVNPICPYNCDLKFKCFAKESLYQKSFSEKSVFNNCDKNYFYKFNPQILTIEKLKKDYLPLGITHFCFDSFLDLDKKIVFDFYLNYFIKEEFQIEVNSKYEKFYATGII